MPSGVTALNFVPIPLGVCCLAHAAWTVIAALQAGGGLLEHGVIPCSLICRAAGDLWLGTGYIVGCVALLLEQPGFYCKRANGSIPVFVWLYLGSWMVTYRAWWFLKQLLLLAGVWKNAQHDRLYDLVMPRLLLGRLTWERPSWPDQPEVDMVVDVTCEWSEPPALASVPHYVLVSVLDTTRPTVQQTIDAARRILQHLADRDLGSVYVHCANGYGRSAVICAAVLLLGGHCGSVEEACEALAKVRPVVALRKAGKRKMCERMTHRELLQLVVDRIRDEDGNSSPLIDGLSDRTAAPL